MAMAHGNGNGNGQLFPPAATVLYSSLALLSAFFFTFQASSIRSSHLISSHLLPPSATKRRS
jgi:hypothetical protein